MGKTKDRRDVFYRRSKQLGYRARSAFKLLQIDQEFGLFDGKNNVVRAVDLCGAPGSWSQVLSRKLWKDEEDKTVETRIVSVDLQEIAPIEGVKCLQGDITSQKTAEEIIACFSGNKCDIVVSDGAPDVTGCHEIDEYLQAQLLLAALNIATFLLRPGGSFVAKIFRGKNVTLLYTQLQSFFEFVTIAKPKSSRNSSYESFVVCQNYRPPADYVPNMDVPMLGLPYNQEEPMIGASKSGALVPFLACGDLAGFDSDMSYSLEGEEEMTPAVPTQLPINPSYQAAVEFKRKRGHTSLKSVPR